VPSARHPRRRVEEALVGAVHDHRDPVRGHAARDGQLAQGFVNGDDRVGDRGARPGGAGHQREERAQATTREAVAEEFGHVLVKVEEERQAREVDRKGGKGQEVRQGGDLDEAIAPMPMLDGQPNGDDPSEGEVLREVAGEPGEPAADGQADDSDPVPNLDLRLAGVAKAEQVDIVPGLAQGLRLPSDTRVVGERGMRDDGDPTNRAGGCHRAFTSFHRSSLAAGSRSARTSPRSAASRSTAA
jgi:hypothetical protein